MSNINLELKLVCDTKIQHYIFSLNYMNSRPRYSVYIIIPTLGRRGRSTIYLNPVHDKLYQYLPHYHQKKREMNKKSHILSNYFNN